MSFIHLNNSSFQHGSRQILGPNSASSGGSGEPGAGDFLGGVGFVPLDVLVKTINLRIQAALGGGITESFRLKTGNNIHLGTALTISDPNTLVTSLENITLPAVNVASNAAIVGTQNYRSEWVTGSSTKAGVYCTEYSVPSQPRLSLYMSGPDFGSCTFDGSNTFAPFKFRTFSNLQTEAAQRIIWPVAGTGQFQFFCVLWNSLSAGTSVEFALRVNGVDAFFQTLGPTSPTSNWQGIVDITTVQPVTGGDLLAWRCKRVAGAGSSINVVVCIGYLSP